ncbi:hypothetical protein F2P81_005821 [Scophthalmus maximus]|uniref:Uncharacterized protein n=1 Tax=Scophthalmus maximus TaxID=52904 RepID=A0A6A4TBQ2_SCOMX|nr:hypothetical protein F2P81_005821 [Scophthalmus maximus]
MDVTTQHTEPCELSLNYSPAAPLLPVGSSTLVAILKMFDQHSVNAYIFDTVIGNRSSVGCVTGCACQHCGDSCYKMSRKDTFPLKDVDW